MKLPESFYLNENIVEVAKMLLGKVLVTYKNNILTSGIICETEAYAGITDKASHAHGNKRTKRTEVMFRRGGIAYVYLCYGVHHLFNVVTNAEGIPDAVLIRAIIPLDGKGEIAVRANKPKNKINSDGPGKISKLLSITTSDSGKNLLGNEIWIENRGIVISENDIQTGKRIGVDYAEEDSNLPYRFWFEVSSLRFEV